MEVVRVAMAKETRRRLRQIAGLTDETMTEVVERLAVVEQRRVMSEVQYNRPQEPTHATPGE